MLDWIFSIPSFVLGLVMVGTFVTLGLIGLSLTRRWVLPWLGDLSRAGEFTATVHHGILIIYGLAVALIAVAVWENYTDATKLATGEATALASLYRDASGYPEPVRGRVRARIREYTAEIIQVAWPQQRSGHVPTQGVEMVDRIEQEMFAFVPAGEAEAILHTEALHAYNRMVEARRQRLDVVGCALPPAMWAVVLFGGLVAMFASFLFEVGNPRLQRLVIALLASVLGLLVFMIVRYDYPFRGVHGIGCESYELVYDQLMKP